MATPVTEDETTARTHGPEKGMDTDVPAVPVSAVKVNISVL